MPPFLTFYSSTHSNKRLFCSLIFLALSTVTVAACGGENFATVSIGDEVLVFENPRISVREGSAKDLILVSNSEDQRLTLFAFEIPKKATGTMAIGPDEIVSGTYVSGPLVKSQRSDGVWVENTFVSPVELTQGELVLQSDESGQMHATFWATICPEENACDVPMRADGTFVY